MAPPSASVMTPMMWAGLVNGGCSSRKGCGFRAHTFPRTALTQWPIAAVRAVVHSTDKPPRLVEILSPLRRSIQVAAPNQPTDAQELPCRHYSSSSASLRS